MHSLSPTQHKRRDNNFLSRLHHLKGNPDHLHTPYHRPKDSKTYLSPTVKILSSAQIHIPEPITVPTMIPKISLPNVRSQTARSHLQFLYTLPLNINNHGRLYRSPGCCVCGLPLHVVKSGHMDRPISETIAVTGIRWRFLKKWGTEAQKGMRKECVSI